MSDIIEKAKARAAAIVAKAELEVAIAEQLPAIDGQQPLIVIQAKGTPNTLLYKPKSLDDIMAIVDGFEALHVWALDYKTDHRRTAPQGEESTLALMDHPKYEDRGEWFAWIALSARCADYMGPSQDAKICFYAKLPASGEIVTVSIGWSAACFEKCPYPSELVVPFERLGRNDWRRGTPRVYNRLSNTVSFGTGAPAPEMAHQGRGMLATYGDLLGFIDDAKGGAV